MRGNGLNVFDPCLQMQNKKIYAVAEIFKAATSSDDAATVALIPQSRSSWRALVLTDDLFAQFCIDSTFPKPL